MTAHYMTKIAELPQALRAFAAPLSEKLPEDWYAVRALAPWQTLLWAFLRVLFAAMFGFLAVLPFVSRIAVTVRQWAWSALFAALAIYLVVRGWQKIKEWRAYTKQFLLFTPQYFVERQKRRATVIPWSTIKGVEIVAPDSEKGIHEPIVSIKTQDGPYLIEVGRPLTPLTGTTRSQIYTVIPGAMAFSPEPAYYTEGALAIKNKLKEYLEHFGAK